MKLFEFIKDVDIKEPYQFIDKMIDVMENEIKNADVLSTVVLLSNDLLVSAIEIHKCLYDLGLTPNKIEREIVVINGSIKIDYDSIVQHGYHERSYLYKMLMIIEYIIKYFDSHTVFENDIDYKLYKKQFKICKKKWGVTKTCKVSDNLILNTIKKYYKVNKRQKIKNEFQNIDFTGVKFEL